MSIKFGLGKRPTKTSCTSENCIYASGCRHHTSSKGGTFDPNFRFTAAGDKIHWEQCLSYEKHTKEPR